MIRSKRTSLSLLALSIALGGCSGSLLESKRIDYKSAKQIERPLEIPPDLTAPQRDDRFAVPDVAPRGVATYSAYTADRAGQPAQATSGPLVLAKSDTMRIERAGSQRWLVVGGTPEELWPQIKDFWLELGFILNIDSPEIGVMETDWAEDRAKIPQDFLRSSIGKVLDGLFSTPERDKFRTRLEQGKETGTVEVYISHRGMMEIYPTEAKDSTIWQPRPDGIVLSGSPASVGQGSDPDPALLDLARARPDLRAGMVAESLRMDPAVATLPRLADEDGRLVVPGSHGGSAAQIDIAAGTIVLCGIASANRDPDVFADPDSFDPTRDHGEMLTFGLGQKYCPGAHLARRQLAAALDAIVDGLPNLSPMSLSEPCSAVLRRSDRLCVTWGG